jgi:hypothetical protein
MLQDHKAQNLREVGVVAALAGVAFAFWILWAVYGVRLVYSAMVPGTASAPGIGELGQVGDLFGGVNALFAAIAVVGVFWAAYLQRRALIETRRALMEERAASARQQFEATFFQLISLFRSLVAELQIEVARGSPLAGFSAVSLDTAVKEILGDRDALADFFDARPNDPVDAVAWHSQIAHDKVFKENETQVGPLFRTLTSVFEHVDTLSEHHPADATRYARIVLDQLSKSLLTLYAFYAVIEAPTRSARLIQRFHLLAPLVREEYRANVLRQALGWEAFSGDEPLSPMPSNA